MDGILSTWMSWRCEEKKKYFLKIKFKKNKYEKNAN